jgi:hypothetical protein
MRQGLIRGDAPNATWVTEVEVICGPDEADYRGEAVHGRRGKRFLDLTWGTVQDQEFTMFGRAKVLLNDLPTHLRPKEAAVVSVPRTQEDGIPRCARVPADVLTWREDRDR